MMEILRVVSLLTTSIFIAEGTLFSRSKCQISSQVYVDQFKVLAEDAESLIHCSALALFSKCERTLFNAEKKRCVCVVVVDSDVTPSQEMTELDDLLASLGNDTFFYEVLSTNKECSKSGYIWVSELELCIKVVEGTKTYDDADEACKIDGTRLVSTETRKQSRALIRSLVCNGYTSTFWIGLNDRANELSYLWLDKTPVSYTKWGPRQPSNNVPLEDCISLQFQKDALDYAWYDEVCTNSYGFICGVKEVLQKAPAVPVSKTKL